MKNREIKFRCFGKESKKWFYYDEIQGRHGINPDQECSDSFQFTGLKDKNGKEIYEGDILKNTKHKNQLVEVYWKGCFTKDGCVNGNHWIDWGGWYFRKMKNDKNYTFATYDNEIEVIGNIWENPELLKP